MMVSSLVVVFLCSLCPFALLCSFMDNLQTEVLEIEFLSYSKGLPTISAQDFAQVLLRYTTVDNVSTYLENVKQNFPDDKVICLYSFICNVMLMAWFLPQINLSVGV